MGKQLITNVQLFDGENKSLYPAEVLITGNRIETVATAQEQLQRDGADVLDGGGATLMPGMVNCHAHPTYCNMDDMYMLGEIPVEEHVLKTMHNVKIMLDHGFTAAVSGASAKPRTDIVIRNEINAGGIPGPRFQAGTQEITVTGGLGDARQLHMYHENVGVVLDGPEAIRKYVRTMIREGVDSVKLMISGDNFVPSSTAQMTVMEEDEVAAGVRVARSHNRRVIAHARTAAAVKLCIKYGIELIYHANFCDEEALDLLEKNKDRHFVNPAIGLSYTPLYEMQDYGMTQDMAEMFGFRQELDGAIDTMQKLHKRGVRVLPFGDYGFQWNKIGEDARDLEHFVKLMGFPPADVLIMATKYGGECFGDKIGMVAAGYLADLLLVDGNPLADVGILRDPDNLLMIMKDGRLHKPLQARRSEERQAAA